MKIISIVGARPQFIKYLPMAHELSKKHDAILVHTGQHYDNEMSDLFFDELSIPPPDYHLGIRAKSHGEQVGRMLIALEKIIEKETPHLILVYGDTNSTLAGALSATKSQVSLGHIEAGVRSYDKTMPEEINRVVTDHCADFLFVPIASAVENLKKEGISKGVFLTGDVMYDTLKYNLQLTHRSTIMDQLNLTAKQYLLVTVHRQSNTDDAVCLSNILEGISKSKETIVFPMHPRTQMFLSKYHLKKLVSKNIRIIKPVGYIDFLSLLQNAKKVVTDSGGVQKEAYMLKIPCITLRNNSEWMETILDGWNILVGCNKEKIVDAIINFTCYKRQKNYFGDGKASQKICRVLENYPSHAV